MRHYSRLFILCIMLCIGMGPQPSFATPPTRIAQVTAVKIDHQHKKNLRMTYNTQMELERILSHLDRMIVMGSYHLPTQYIKFQFPTPVVLANSPVGHPIRELIITHPKGAWDPPRLLIRNPQKQWVEYRSTYSLIPILQKIHP